MTHPTFLRRTKTFPDATYKRYKPRPKKATQNKPFTAVASHVVVLTESLTRAKFSQFSISLFGKVVHYCDVILWMIAPKNIPIASAKDITAKVS